MEVVHFQVKTLQKLIVQQLMQLDTLAKNIIGAGLAKKCSIN